MAYLENAGSGLHFGSIPVITLPGTARAPASQVEVTGHMVRTAAPAGQGPATLAGLGLSTSECQSLKTAADSARQLFRANNTSVYLKQQMDSWDNQWHEHCFRNTPTPAPSQSAMDSGYSMQAHQWMDVAEKKFPLWGAASEETYAAIRADLDRADTYIRKVSSYEMRTRLRTRWTAISSKAGQAVAARDRAGDEPLIPPAASGAGGVWTADKSPSDTCSYLPQVLQPLCRGEGGGGGGAFCASLLPSWLCNEKMALAIAGLVGLAILSPYVAPILRRV